MPCPARSPQSRELTFAQIKDALSSQLVAAPRRSAPSSTYVFMGHAPGGGMCWGHYTGRTRSTLAATLRAGGFVSTFWRTALARAPTDGALTRELQSPRGQSPVLTAFQQRRGPVPLGREPLRGIRRRPKTRQRFPREKLGEAVEASDASALPHSHVPRTRE